MGLDTLTERLMLDRTEAVAACCAASATVDADARLGAGCRVGPNAFVGAAVVLGADCVIEHGAHLGPGTVLEDQVYVGAHASFCSAPGPVQRAVVVRQGAWIGANASIAAAGIVIGAQAVVRPGAVVTRSVAPGAIVEGNPAQTIGYRNASAGPPAQSRGANTSASALVAETSVKGVTVHHFPIIPDLRGNLSVGEFDRQIPFKPLRYFLVFDVPSRELRGEHAHRRCHQFLICLRGNCAVVADDGEQRVEVALDSPHRGVYLPPMTWGVQYKYSSDAMLLVFASDHYDASDYIRDYGEFLALVRPDAAVGTSLIAS